MTHPYSDVIVWGYILFAVIAGFWFWEYLRDRYWPPPPTPALEYTEVSTSLRREK